MKPLRCLIADIPQKVLADILERVTEEVEDIKVVGQVLGMDEVSHYLNRHKIDVLILGMHVESSNLFCREILRQFPNLLIVGLVDDGRMAVVCLGDVGSHQLVRAITVLGNRQGIDG